MNALEIQNLKVSLGGRVVLEDVSLVLGERDFLGLIGPNGAGKTIFLKTIVGLVRPESGTIKIFGEDVFRARRGVGYVPQFNQFEKGYPIIVRDVVAMGRLARKRLGFSFTAEDQQKITEVMERFEIAGLSDRAISQLSGGQLQRVLIARALVGEPKLLLLDEPTASLDTAVGRSFYQILKELSEQMAIILVSHDIGVMADYVKTIGCLNRRLHYHEGKELTPEMLHEVYGCPVELIAHGHAHRVLNPHGE